MNKKKTISLLLIGALALAAGFGVVAYRTVKAATPLTSGITHMGFGGGFERGVGGVSDTDLAAALGITTDQLATARQTAFNNVLDTAVKNGLITQAQADTLKANNGAFPFGKRWEGWLSQNGINYDQALADALNITLDKLQAAYQQAFNARIDQAVANGNLTQDQADLIKGEYALRSSSSFQSAMKSAFEAAVNQAVTAGVITQSQADKILQQANNQSMFGFGMGRMGGFGGRHGFRGGFGGFGGGLAPTNPGTETAPTTPVSPSSFNGL